MKKRIAALFMTVVLILSMTPSFAVSPERTNPFEAADLRRRQGIDSSLQRSGAVRAAGTIGATAAPAGDFIENGLIVQFKESVSLEQIHECLSGYSYRILSDSRNRLFEISVSDADGFTKSFDSLILYSGRARTRAVDIIPDDPRYSEQWAPDAVNLPEAWDLTQGSAEVKVAVIDSGFYRGHEDLSGTSVLQGYDICADQPNVTSDEIGHGTMVTSIIAATTNNAKGMAGGCWNITVIPYKVADAKQLIDSADVIAAVMMAADAGCDVINLSLGGYELDPAEAAAIEYAYGKGCIIIASAGNEGSYDDPERGMPSYPASEPKVISVASLGPDSSRSYFSQYNSMVDVTAPGEDILVAYTESMNSYAVGSGTSFSAPYVSAAAALVRSIEPSISADYFEQLVIETSTDLGAASRDDYYGWGLLDAAKLADQAEYPVVIGAMDGGTYTSARTITFNKGTAVINGIPFSSGSEIPDTGNYTLVVSDSDGHSTTIHFSIDSDPLTVGGVQEGGVYRSDRVITFDRGTATLNGTMFNSGSVVSAEGIYTLVLTGPFGNTLTLEFTIDKTAPVITGVTEGATYSNPVMVRFNEGMGTLNGNPVQSGHAVYTMGSYTLSVVDAAGNSSTVHFSLSGSYEPNISVAMTTELTQWVLDDSGNTLFAISKAGGSLLCINPLTLQTEKTVALGGGPTDIICSEDKLYIALNDVNRIAVVDIATRTIDRKLVTVSDPYNLALDGDKLFYAERDQWCDIYVYDLLLEVDRKISTKFYHAPDLAINTEDHILYIGESGTTASAMAYFSITEDRIISETAGDSTYGSINTIYNGNSVFYAGRAFSATSAKRILGDFNGGQQVIFAENGCVFTNSAVYDEDTHIKAGDLKSQVNLIETAEAGYVYLYDKANQRITKVVCTSGRIDPDEIIHLVGGDPAPEFPSATQSAVVSEGMLSLEMMSDLTSWVIDDETNTLFAVSRLDKALFFIDATTLDITGTIRFRSGPTDIAISGGSLYIPMSNAYQIAVVDIASRLQTETFYTQAGPFRIAVDEEKIYYVEEDQHCYVFSVSLSSGADEMLAIGSYYFPDIEVSTTSHILYIGESQSTGSTLSYYDTISETIIGESERLYGPERSVLCDGNFVFYAAKAFDPMDPSLYSDIPDMPFNENFLVAKYGYVFTESSCYYYDDSEYFIKLFDFENPIMLAALSGHADLFTFDMVNNTILRVEGEGVPPEVTGVKDGAGYIGEVTITFDKGTAILDGIPFANGGTVAAPGGHTLVVSDPDSPETVVHFFLYASQAGDDIPVLFPDPYLKAALLSNDADANADGVIVRGEMRVLSGYLDLYGSGITDLGGLEYAVNLKELDLSGNSLSDISALSGMTQMTYLDLSENLISDISPLAGMTGLTELDLLTNRISNLVPLAGLTGLEALDLSDNRISDISSLAGLTALGRNDGWLYLSDNTVQDIRILAGLTDLSDLDLSRNPITDFSPLAGLDGLMFLALNGNHLTDISFLENLSGIMFLDLSDNSISDISVLQSMPDLFYLVLYSNKIRDISVLEGLTYLYLLDLSDNEIYNIMPLMSLYPMLLDISGNYLDLDASSEDMTVITYLMAGNEDMIFFYEPQKDIPPEFYPPVITIGSYNQNMTNQNITVTASTNKGTLNAASHTFTQNGSFDFVATDAYGNVTIRTVEISNIDKEAPELTLYAYNKDPTASSIIVRVSVSGGTVNATSHTFTQNGSFDFVATDAAGNKTVLRITITNIYTKGDLTGDHEVNGLDLLKLKKHILGQITLSGLDLNAADLNRDGKVDGLDLLKLKKFLLGQSAL
ncbi:MAG: S8 family serine peptidase [Saccharofermentanales bacterium]